MITETYRRFLKFENKDTEQAEHTDDFLHREPN